MPGDAAPILEEPDFTRLTGARVAIVGLGLMGGSLALALRGHCRELVGVDADPQTLTLAHERGVVDRTAEFDAALDCDLLILAAPVRAILAHLEVLKRLPPPGRTVTVLDLGSTKSEIVHAMQDLPPSFDPLGAHPMCGKEVSGLAHAEAGLYRDRVFVLTPLERTSTQALALARALVAVIGARPFRLAPEQHDRLAAMSSHLPYTVAALLVRAAEGLDDEQVWTLAASGFRDTSRLAASDMVMMIDILLTNRTAVLEALGRYRGELDDLTALLEAGDVEGLRALLRAAQARRRSLFQ